MTEQDARQALNEAMTKYRLHGSAASRRAYVDAQMRYDHACKENDRPTPQSPPFAQ